MKEGSERRKFFTNLLEALWALSDEEKRTPGTFAAFQGTKPAQGFLLRSIQIEGAGDLQIPLSIEDVSKLRSVCKQAPFGRGSANLVDTSVRRCWQLDASKVSFPGRPTFLSDTIQPLAMRVVRALCVNGAAVQFEAHLHKLLFYESGGHFKFHRDTEKETGMFATLILQLPTAEGYTGGQLLIKHNNEVSICNGQMASTLRLCYTMFSADCLHKLRKIESGTRLCLAFNLVRRDCSSQSILRGPISRRVQQAEEALEPWWKAARGGKLNFIGGKLAFRLQHKYTATDLSFARLKGHDSTLAEVLKKCRDWNKRKWLDLYLCRVTKHQSGIPSPVFYSVDYNSDEFDPMSGYNTMRDIKSERIEFENWIGEDDQPMSVAWIKELRIDFEKEVVTAKKYDNFPFDSDPDQSEYEDGMGDNGPTLQHWYHTAMLVVWPKALSISIRCEVNVSHALAALQTSAPNFCEQLHQVVLYCQRNPLRVWDQCRDSNKDSVSPRLLRLCNWAGLYEDVLQILQLLAKKFISGSTTFRIGVRSAEVAKEIATAVQEMAWELVSSSIIDLVKKCALTQCESFAELAKQLILTGSNEAGRLVAKTIDTAFMAHIGQLEWKMPPEPVFSWCQPHARLSGLPDVERFLKGPTEKLMLTDFGSIAAARTHKAKLCSTPGSGYSATVRTGGQARNSFCAIEKTREIFEAAEGNWREKQEELKRFRLAYRRFSDTVETAVRERQRSDQQNRERQSLDEVPGDTTAVPEATASTTLIPSRAGAVVTPVPDGSDQQERQRLEELPRDATNKRAGTSPQVFIDMTVNTLPDRSHNKRAKTW